ncbi:MAG: PTS system mannose/fructose/N-acetylgalactosamine-transporter subunit IIB [Cetobacterium sp.]|uniref:PTS system mannose/fructose/N-acetylgalactosamine-transporter subunit IIB n=1 Tax=Cetobacterium sp. TaxID=2071632 RepID=UPI003F32FB43
MPISFVRIDDRVIHGQIVTKWSKFKKCNGILVIGDDIATDEFRCKVLKAAAPSNVKVGIYTVEEGIEKIEKARNAQNSYFVISNSPLTFQKLVEAGANFGEELNVGPMSARENAKTMGRNLAITPEEKEAFEKIQSQGIKISFQLTPDDSSQDWNTLKQKY